MEHFEDLATVHPGAANPAGYGIDNLEKEAFQRGLPATVKPFFGSVNCTVQYHTQPDVSSLAADKATKKAPLILLIDDEENFRCVLKQVLVNAGYEVVEASNGAEGIKYFYQNPADMIVTDIIMPEKEGIETILELKRAFPDVKLIAMSGGGWYGTDIDFDMAKKLGARTLDKPFPLQDLLDAVNELLN